jgi:hypothetical protein
MIAVCHGQLDIVEALIAAGADVNARQLVSRSINVTFLKHFRFHFRDLSFRTLVGAPDLMFYFSPSDEVFTTASRTF